jgi:uncharacterized hydrophobic protein (TIGR00341 family)
MRLIQAFVPTSRRDEVSKSLSKRGLEHVFVDDSSDSERCLTVFPVPPETVEELIEELRGIGVESEGVIVVSETRTVVSDVIEGRDGRDEEEVETSEDDRISREELLSRATESGTTTPNYVAFIVLSAIVATAGLLGDSAAVVVGSMVIAPLLGPAIATSVGSVLADRDLLTDGAKAQVVGLCLAIVSGTLFAVVLRYTIAPIGDILVLDQIAERTNPGALSLVIAVVSGAAGALSFTTGANTALVGVMMAAALIPPAAAVGVGIAFGDAVLAISAGVLVLVNVVAINLVSTLVLWWRGYRPERAEDERRSRKTALTQVLVLVAAIVLLSSFLVVTTGDIVANERFETEVDEISADRGVLSHEIRYETALFSRSPAELTVRVAEGDGATAEEIQRDVLRETGVDVEVTVVHESVTTAGFARPAPVAPAGPPSPRLPSGISLI